MGSSWIFKNASIGDIDELYTEEDFNDLKYLVTKASSVTFRICKKQKEVFQRFIEFFKFLPQKFKFLPQLDKVKIRIKFGIINNELQENEKEKEKEGSSLQSSFLEMQKYLNKYMFLKKWARINPGKGNSNENENENEKEKFLIKVDYDDLIFRVKKLKNSMSNLQLNYFSYTAFTKCDYDNRSISSFFLNEKYTNYDHLLPIFIQNVNYQNYLQQIEKIILEKNLNNIKLPALVVNSGNSKNLDLFFDTINSLKSKLKFFDLSFVIYIDHLEDIKTITRSVISKISKCSINSEIPYDYIIRFYVFSPFLNLNNIRGIKKFFIQGISLAVPRKNSYIILNFFRKCLVPSITNNHINPNIHDHLQDKILRLEEESFNARMEKLFQKINNINNINNYNNIYNIRNYDPNAHFEAAVNFRAANLLSLTKYVHKIYANTSFQISNVLLCVNSKDASLCVTRLKRKPILRKIFSFLSINLIEKVYNQRNNTGSNSDEFQLQLQLSINNCKNFVFNKFINIQEEFTLPVIKNPKSEEELHEDLVHIHYDQAFNLLRYSGSGEESDKENKK